MNDKYVVDRWITEREIEISPLAERELILHELSYNIADLNFD